MQGPGQAVGLIQTWSCDPPDLHSQSDLHFTPIQTDVFPNADSHPLSAGSHLIYMHVDMYKTTSFHIPCSIRGFIRVTTFPKAASMDSFCVRVLQLNSAFFPHARCCSLGLTLKPTMKTWDLQLALPMLRASSGPTKRPVKIISLALLLPISRGNRCVPPALYIQ